MPFRRNRTETPPVYVLSPHAAQDAPHMARLPVSERPTEIWVGVPPIQTQPRRRTWLWLLMGGLVMMVLAMVFVAVAAGGLLYYSKVVMPGTQVMGVDIGWQTTAESASTLQTAWESRTITLVAGDHTWQVAPQTLGMTLDAPATAESAYQYGRSVSNLLNGLIGSGSLDVPPVWMFDANIAQTQLQTLAPNLQVPPVNAGLRVVDGRIEATPAIPGQQLDLPATLSQLQTAAATVMTNGRFDLITTPIQPEISDMSAAAAQANQLLAAPLSVRAYDPVRDETAVWDVLPEVWVSWLALDVTANGQLTWGINRAQLETFLTTQANLLGEDRYFKTDDAETAVSQAINNKTSTVTLRVYHHDRYHIVQSGETLSSIGRLYGIPYPWIQQANPGADSLSVGQTLTIPSPDVMLPLPVVEGKRIVVSISQQRVWAYENGAVKWEWPASTGIDSSPTSPGVFQIRSHEENAYAGNWDLWMPSFMGIYQPVPTSEFMNGFHGFPTRGGSQLLWTGDLGHQVTYGCILVSSENAELLYNWAEEGVVVEIRP